MTKVHTYQRPYDVAAWVFKLTLLLLTMISVVMITAAAAAEPQLDPLLQLLVTKGLISQAEAEAVQAESLAAAEPPAEQITAAAEPMAPEAVIKGVKGLKIGTLAYLSFQDGSKPDGAGGSEDYSQFSLKRAYIDIRKQLTDHIDVRITPDAHLDESGDLKVRLKYLYARFGFDDVGLLNHPHVEVGLSHMPWLDFEEHINRFRMQDTMFMERYGLFNSADMGVLFASKLGPDLDREHLGYLNSDYAGRWGSFGAGIFSGGGYHAAEKNNNKALEGRFTLRPAPDMLPGFQISLFGISGKGNQTDDHGLEAPDWQVLAAMLSYEHPRFAVTAQYADGKGNQKGSAVDETGDALPFSGYSLFAEVRLDAQSRFSLIGRYDSFDPDSENAAGDEYSRFIVGVAWQFYKGNYWVLDYDRLVHDASGVANEDRLQLTLQIKY